jgi:hypothetical protein
MNISDKRIHRGSSSQPVDAKSNSVSPNTVQGRRAPGITVPVGFSLADITPGGLWSTADYTSAAYTGVDKE